MCFGELTAVGWTQLSGLTIKALPTHMHFIVYSHLLHVNLASSQSVQQRSLLFICVYCAVC